LGGKRNLFLEVRGCPQRLVLPENGFNPEKGSELGLQALHHRLRQQALFADIPG
jgi:hypothetical protein